MNEPHDHSAEHGASHNHGHSHDHSHHHDQHLPHNHGLVSNLRLAFLLNLAFAAIELVGGLLTNSVAILADAAHDFGDAVTLAVAMVMERMAGRSRTAQLTYGYRRFSTLGALITGLVLIAGAITVLTHAVPRLIAPQAVDARGMMLLAVLGIAVNALAAVRLARTSSMNARAAFLHLLEDLIGWIGVLIGAVAIRIWNVYWLDPLLAVAINIFVLSRAVPIVLSALRVLLQFVPGSISADEAQELVAAVDGVGDVHDVHLWTLDGEYVLFSAHIVPDKDAALSGLEQLKQVIRHRLNEAGINHVTIELEAPGAGCGDCDL